MMSEPKKDTSLTESESERIREEHVRHYETRNDDGYSPASVRAQNILCGRDPNWRPDW